MKIIITLYGKRESNVGNHGHRTTGGFWVTLALRFSKPLPTSLLLVSSLISCTCPLTVAVAEDKIAALVVWE